MFSSKFHNNEKLYRVIRDKEEWWDEEEDKPSSAAFKDSKGVSVGRDNTQEEEGIKIQDDFKQRFRRDIRAIAYVTAQECSECNTILLYNPSNNSIHHSEILRSLTEKLLTSPQAYYLSQKTIITYRKY